MSNAHGSLYEIHLHAEGLRQEFDPLQGKLLFLFAVSGGAATGYQIRPLRGRLPHFSNLSDPRNLWT